MLCGPHTFSIHTKTMRRAHGCCVSYATLYQRHPRLWCCPLVLWAQGDLTLVGYCDSDFYTCPITQRSLTVYLMTLGGSPISQKTKKKTTVSWSSAEAEYRSITRATSELVWLKSLLASVGIFHSYPIHLFCDSKAVLHIANNLVFQQCIKHIEINCHFVRECLQSGDLTLSHIASKLQPIDIFTEALGLSLIHIWRCRRRG